MFQSFVLKISSLVVLALSIAACGGGGGSGGDSTPDNGGGITVIEFADLPRLEVNEGAEVTLSLSPRNTNGANLTYDWEVTLAGEALPFSGQDTPTIRFTAPQVNATSSISVSVRFDLVNGNLSGNKSDSTSVIVRDSNPSPEARLAQVTGSEFDETIPEVDNIVLTNIGAESTWALTEFVFIEQDADNDFSQVVGLHETVYVTRSGDEAPEIAGCTDDSGTPLDEWLNAYEADASCPVESLEIKRYQDENSLAVRTFCDDGLISAIKLERVSDGLRSDYGQISLEISSDETFSANENVCFRTLRSVLYNSEAEQAFSILAVKTLYQEEDLTLLITTDSIRSGFSFGGVNPDSLSEISLVSPVLPQFADENFSSGSYSFDSWENGAITGEFRATYSTATSIDSLDGSFSFNQN